MSEHKKEKKVFKSAESVMKTYFPNFFLNQITNIDQKPTNYQIHETEYIDEILRLLKKEIKSKSD